MIHALNFLTFITSYAWLIVKISQTTCTETNSWFSFHYQLMWGLCGMLSVRKLCASMTSTIWSLTSALQSLNVSSSAMRRSSSAVRRPNPTLLWSRSTAPLILSSHCMLSWQSPQTNSNYIKSCENYTDQWTFKMSTNLFICIAKQHRSRKLSVLSSHVKLNRDIVIIVELLFNYTV